MVNPNNHLLSGYSGEIANKDRGKLGFHAATSGHKRHHPSHRGIPHNNPPYIGDGLLLGLPKLYYICIFVCINYFDMHATSLECW